MGSPVALERHERAEWLLQTEDPVDQGTVHMLTSRDWVGWLKVWGLIQ